MSSNVFCILTSKPIREHLKQESKIRFYLVTRMVICSKEKARFRIDIGDASSGKLM